MVKWTILVIIALAIACSSSSKKNTNQTKKMPPKPTPTPAPLKLPSSDKTQYLYLKFEPLTKKFHLIIYDKENSKDFAPSYTATKIENILTPTLKKTIKNYFQVRAIWKSNFKIKFIFSFKDPTNPRQVTTDNTFFCKTDNGWDFCEEIDESDEIYED